MSSFDSRLDSLASPARARSLLTVRAAISLAFSSLVPRSSSPSLMCSYWRSRFLDQAPIGMTAPFGVPLAAGTPRAPGYTGLTRG
jgi:hypothetical protein